MNAPKINTKTFIAGALAYDQQATAHGQTGHVTAWDARQILHGVKRASPKGSIVDAKPNRITLAVDDLPGFPGTGSDLLHSLADVGTPRYVLVVMAVSVEAAEEVVRVATSRIVRPDQPIGGPMIPRNGRP